MNAFEYAAPGTLELAVKALAGSDGAEALSGGTDLLSRIKDDTSSPKRVVNLKTVKGLDAIAAADGGLTIGAGVRLADLVASKDVADKYPALVQAALEVGTPQIRNMATVGGNLLQRPRDWYYRAGFGLVGGRRDGNALVRELEGEYAPFDVDSKAKHLVREGDNRYAAIFMTDGDALFVAPSSLAVPLVALGATATITGPKGERTVPVAGLYQAPRAEGDRELTLTPGEILTKVTIPAPAGKNASYEARQKRAHDWPLALCTVVLAIEGDKVTKAAVVLGSVAPVPWVSKAAQEAIVGKPVTMETAAAAAAAAVKEARPLSMNAYKVKLAETVVKRALLAAVGNRYWEA